MVKKPAAPQNPDEVLKRMLGTPPAPHKKKPKPEQIKWPKKAK